MSIPYSSLPIENVKNWFPSAAMPLSSRISSVAVAILKSPQQIKCSAFALSRGHLDGPLLRRADEGGNVEDQGHAAVAHDRRPGDAIDLAVVRLNALDDELALGDEFVDHDRHLARFVLDDDEQRVFGAGFPRDRFEYRVQTDQREYFPADLDHLSAARDHADVAGFRPNVLDNACERQNVHLAAH